MHLRLTDYNYFRRRQSSDQQKKILLWESVVRKRPGPWVKDLSKDSLPRLVIFVFILMDLKLTKKLFASLSVINKNGGPCTEQVT